LILIICLLISAFIYGFVGEYAVFYLSSRTGGIWEDYPGDES
jgi:hypothetical protein